MSNTSLIALIVPPNGPSRLRMRPSTSSSEQSVTKTQHWTFGTANSRCKGIYLSLRSWISFLTLLWKCWGSEILRTIHYVHRGSNCFSALVRPQTYFGALNFTSVLYVSGLTVEKTIILVGGFSASNWLFSRLQDLLQPLEMDFYRPDSHVYGWVLYLTWA